MIEELIKHLTVYIPDCSLNIDKAVEQVATTGGPWSSRAWPA